MNGRTVLVMSAALILSITGLFMFASSDQKSYRQEQEAKREAQTLARVAFALEEERSREAAKEVECLAQKCPTGMPALVKDACWCVFLIGNPEKP